MRETRNQRPDNIIGHIFQPGKLIEYGTQPIFEDLLQLRYLVSGFWSLVSYHSISHNSNSEKLTDMGRYPVEYNCNPYPPVVNTVSSTVISNVSLA